MVQNTQYGHGSFLVWEDLSFGLLFRSGLLFQYAFRVAGGLGQSYQFVLHVVGVLLSSPGHPRHKNQRERVDQGDNEFDFHFWD